MALDRLMVNVYKHADGSDCSNNGISARHSRVMLVQDSVQRHEVLEIQKTLKCPVAQIVRRKLFHNQEIYIHADSTERNDVCYMAGGAMLYSSDSRWSELVGHSYPIKLHDRQEQYYD